MTEYTKVNCHCVLCDLWVNGISAGDPQTSALMPACRVMRAHINATRGAEPWSQMRHPTVQRASPGSLSCLNLYLLELPVQNTNVYCPCRTSRGLFLLARSRFGESLLAQRLTVSVEPCPPQIFCDYIPYP